MDQYKHEELQNLREEVQDLKNEIRLMRSETQTKVSGAEIRVTRICSWIVFGILVLIAALPDHVFKS